MMEQNVFFLGEKWFKSVPEQEEGSCTGCVFRGDRPNTSTGSRCAVIDRAIGNITFGEACNENQSIYANSEPSEPVEPKYTVYEVLDTFYSRLDYMQDDLPSKKEIIKLIEDILVLKTDPQYNQYIELKRKFEPISK